jgi:exodeoxyribonuclease VII large subunit
MRKPFLQPQQPGQSRQRQVLTVSQLNLKAKHLMESELGSVWLEGEISNFIQAASGHWYFTLKDNTAQIKCAIFKFKNRLINLSPKEGDKVIVKGKVSLYEARGDYQMIADYMEPAGLGNLQQTLNALIKKLEAQGLFSADNKKPLPFLPKSIGVITSPTGAAIHDVITVLQRRCPMIPIIIYPTQVQGKTAVTNIIAALENAQRRNECDVLLMTRGGGSLEDLWSFNDEQLAQKISECHIPLVAAIGHEVDTTITELVADLRAATPSAAAELVAPDQQSLWQKLDIYNQDLNNCMSSKIYNLQTRLNIARLKLKDPEHSILLASRQLEISKNKLREAFLYSLEARKNRLERLSKKLAHFHPKEKLLRNKHQLEVLENRLKNSLQKILQQTRNQLIIAANNLNTLSPLSTLGRGYSITRDKKSKKVITKVSQVNSQQNISIMLSDGEIDCLVK